jgi:hypothetical protein
MAASLAVTPDPRTSRIIKESIFVSLTDTWICKIYIPKLFKRAAGEKIAALKSGKRSENETNHIKTAIRVGDSPRDVKLLF